MQLRILKLMYDCVLLDSFVSAHHHQFGVLSTDGNAVLLSTAVLKDRSEEAFPANVLAKYQ